AANVTLSSQPAAHAIHVGTRIVGVRSYLLLAAELCLQERGSTIDQFARRTGRRARPEILHGGDVAVEGVAVPMTAADLSMFQLSRVYAQGWNAARGLSAGARPNPKIVADLNPYKPGPSTVAFHGGGRTAPGSCPAHNKENRPDDGRQQTASLLAWPSQEGS